MSKIALSGNASGTGTLTIAAPNTDSDRTLTLPDSTGTIQVSGSPISGTTGTFTGLLDISAAGAGQIQFPATQNASANANTLDDYEEGTFTPTLFFGGATVGVTYGAANGTYIKVGRFVYVRVGMLLTNKGSSTGNAEIRNLPFSSTSQSYSDPSGIFNGSTFTGLTSGVVGIVNNGSSNIGIRTNTTTGSTAITHSNFNNNTELYGSFCYVTDN